MKLRGLAMLLSVPLLAPLSGESKPDFRGANWGMTPEQVRATEAGTPAQIGQSGAFSLWLSYPGQFAGRDANIIYIFSNGKLASARYQFTAKHEDLNDFIADYQAIEPLLRKTFGDAVSEKAVWLDDSLQEERKSYLEQDRATPADILPSDRNVGLAVSVGNLKLFTEWSDGQTKATHALTGAGGVITHQIEFRPANAETSSD